MEYKQSEFDFTKYFTQWLENLDGEILFWDQWLATKCFGDTKQFERRCLKDRRLAVSKLTSVSSDQTIRILDVGSGPLAGIGNHVEGKTVEFICADSLARAYYLLLEKHQISPPDPIVNVDAENLSLFFCENHFHISNAGNSLDHTYNPLQSILQMVLVTKLNGGVIRLHHNENEGQKANYSGLHSWNFCEENGDMIVWNQKNERYSIRNLLGEDASVETNVRINKNNGNRTVVCIIHPLKHSEILRSKIKYDLHHKYKILMEGLLASKTAQILKREKLEE